MWRSGLGLRSSYWNSDFPTLDVLSYYWHHCDRIESSIKFNGQHTWVNHVSRLFYAPSYSCHLYPPQPTPETLGLARPRARYDVSSPCAGRPRGIGLTHPSYRGHRRAVRDSRLWHGRKTGNVSVVGYWRRSLVPRALS